MRKNLRSGPVLAGHAQSQPARQQINRTQSADSDNRMPRRADHSRHAKSEKPAIIINRAGRVFQTRRATPFRGHQKIVPYSVHSPLRPYPRTVVLRETRQKLNVLTAIET